MSGPASPAIFNLMSPALSTASAAAQKLTVFNVVQKKGNNAANAAGNDPRLRPASMAMQDTQHKSSIEKEIEDLKRKQND
jgi:hypothetical protein